MEIEKICQLCGKTFKVPHWRDSAKFCSKECSYKSKIAAPNVKCAICGKMFHRKPYHIKRCKGEFGLCCSKKCLAELKKITMSGENNHQFGLKGKLNPCFKDEITTYQNNKLTEYLIYVGEWYRKHNNSGRITYHRYLVELNHNQFNEDYFEKIEDWFYLKDNYEVHHIDLNHTNNDINNLQILTKSEHISLHNKLRNQKRNNKGQFIKTE